MLLELHTWVCLGAGTLKNRKFVIDVIFFLSPVLPGRGGSDYLPQVKRYTGVVIIFVLCFYRGFFFSLFVFVYILDERSRWGFASLSFSCYFVYEFIYIF